MRYGSVCSGIEAATQAWHPLGWSPAFFSEIEAFPSAVLAHHYGSNLPGEPAATNGVPNHGDMTNFEEWPDYAIDLLVGGTPCQSFSVAGLRGGLDDARGNLMLTYGAIARRYRPRWLVWENVPGVLSSDGGRDFASLLGLLSGRRVEVPATGWRNAGIVEGYKGAYGLAWRVLDAQYVRVDGFEHAVPQRRRRVFVVGYIGDWRRAAAVLFEPEGLCGDSAPRRKAGQRPAPTISSRPTGGGGLGTDFKLDGGLIASERDVSGTVSSKWSKGTGGPAGDEVQNLVAHTLKGECFDASEDGTGRGTPLVPVPMTLAIRGRDGQPDIEWRQDGTSNAILTPNGGRAGVGVGAIAFAQNSRDEVRLFGGDGRTVGALAAEPGMKQTTYVAYGLRGDASRSGEAKTPSKDAHGNLRLRDAGFNVYEEHSPTLDTSQTPTVAWSIMPQNSGKDYKARSVEVAQPVMAGGPVGGNQGGDFIQQAWAVRRLTPTECARLQGFPDNHCRIPWRGKPAEQCPDGPQYNGYGNSMAVNVMRWIGQRIDQVEKLFSEKAA